VLSRLRYFISIGLLLFFFCGFFVLSCNEVERHQVLTFFFDGVPPLGRQELDEQSPGSGLPQIEQVTPEPLWYVHEARKDCTNCHNFERQRVISTETYLHTPIPRLCYNCHTDYTISAPYVHGPVAVGQCLQCHHHHKSKIKHILKEPEPELCYKCHDSYAIELIPGHLTKQMSMCTNCHNPHASSTEALLKVSPDRMNEVFSRTKPVNSTLQNYIEVPEGRNETRISESAQARQTAPTQKSSLLQVFSDVNILIEQGNLQKAQLYLMEFKDSSAFTSQERMKIEKVLELIDEALQKQKEDQQERSDSGQYSDRPSSKSQQSAAQLDDYSKMIAQLYYRSIQLYRAGQFAQAREGFIVVINSGMIPSEMEKTIRGYLLDIEEKLSDGSTSQNSRR
jgi:predicted CXXCH cytochrome family protein